MECIVRAIVHVVGCVGIKAAAFNIEIILHFELQLINELEMCEALSGVLHADFRGER